MEFTLKPLELDYKAQSYKVYCVASYGRLYLFNTKEEAEKGAIELRKSNGFASDVFETEIR